MSKTSMLMCKDCNPAVFGIKGLETPGTGLDNHKSCLDYIKTILSSSKAIQHRSDGTTMISNKEYKNKDLAQDKEYMDVRRRLPTYTPLNMSTELKVKDVVLGTYTLTDLFSKDSSAAMNCEARDNETRTRQLMRSVARAASFTIPRRGS